MARERSGTPMGTCAVSVSRPGSWSLARRVGRSVAAAAAGALEAGAGLPQSLAFGLRFGCAPAVRCRSQSHISKPGQGEFAMSEQHTDLTRRERRRFAGARRLAAVSLATAGLAAASASPAMAACPVAGGGATGPTQFLKNYNFDSGPLVGWTTNPVAGVIRTGGGTSRPFTAPWFAHLDRVPGLYAVTLSQTVTLPAGCANYKLGFTYNIGSSQPFDGRAYDKLYVDVLNSLGTRIVRAKTLTTLDRGLNYHGVFVSLPSLAVGGKVTLVFSAYEYYWQAFYALTAPETWFNIDNVALYAYT
jgi:hypothetical protein